MEGKRAFNKKLEAKDSECIKCAIKYCDDFSKASTKCIDECFVVEDTEIPLYKRIWKKNVIIYKVMNINLIRQRKYLLKLILYLL